VTGPHLGIHADGSKCSPHKGQSLDQSRLRCVRHPEVALDLIFGPAMYRMATGHAGLTAADADAIVATAMRALAS
jgi:hypothetical protein